MSRASIARDFLGFALERTAARKVDLPDYRKATSQVNPFFVSGDGVELSEIDAYRRVKDVYMCVDLLQNSVASLPFRFTQGKGKKKKRLERGHPLVDLFHGANPNFSGYMLKKQIVGAMLLSGLSCLFLRYLFAPRPQEVWCYPGGVVEPVAGLKNDPTVTHVMVDIGDGKQKRVELEQVVLIPMYSPDHSMQGMTPLMAAREIWMTSRNAKLWLREFYKKGGATSFFLKIAAEKGGVMPKERERIEHMIMRRAQGIKNAFNPVTLPYNMDIVRAGLTLKEMEFVAASKMTKQDIGDVFHIPPVLIGIKEGGGLSDAGASTDLVNYWENAVTPLTDLIRSAINEGLCQHPLHAEEFGDDIECFFDFSDVIPLQEIRVQRVASAVDAAGRPIASANEARGWVGFEESEQEGMDEVLDREDPAAITGPPAAAGEASARAGGATSGAKDGLAAGGDEVHAEWKVVNAGGVEALRARGDNRIDREMARRGGMRTGVRKLFDAQGDRVVAKLKRVHLVDANANGHVRRAWVVDGNDLLPDSRAEKALLRHYQSLVMESAGFDVMGDVGRRIGIDMRHSRVVRWLDERSEISIVGITRTNRELLVKSLQEGVSAGEDPGELVARAREVFRDRYLGQGEMIVRTEVVSSYNAGAYEAGQQSGVVRGHRWVTSGDERVREAHRDVEGQFQPLGEAFELEGGAQCLFPGDHSHGAPPNLTIGCRCTIVPVVDEEQSSLLDNGESDRIALVANRMLMEVFT